MRFTVSFSGLEDVDCSYGLVFVPGPCWVMTGSLGGEPLVNMSHVPHYRAGGIDKLLKARPELWAAVEASKRVTVIAHQVGHGSEGDLQALVEDLERHGLEVLTIRLPQNTRERPSPN